jgi:hypothetical protein
VADNEIRRRRYKDVTGSDSQVSSSFCERRLKSHLLLEGVEIFVYVVVPHARCGMVVRVM